MNILEQLQGTELPSIEKFSIYIPDKDKDKQPVVNLGDWVTSAMMLLTQINGGSTVLPPARGSWKDKDDEVLEDTTIVVYSFIRKPTEFADRFDEITAFVHEFGLGANQESVLVEMTGGHRAYFIDEQAYR